MAALKTTYHAYLHEQQNNIVAKHFIFTFVNPYFPNVQLQS